MREITKEQFSDNSTIDGRRIDKAVEDIVDRANAVEKRDMKRRFFQTQIVGAYTPSSASASIAAGADTIVTATNEDAIPFMGETNAVVGYTENVNRVKGIRKSGHENISYSMIATNAYLFSRPVIVTGVCVVLEGGNAIYTNNFQYTGEALEDIGKAGYSDDFAVSISVDNPFLPERRELNSEIYHRFDFKLNSQFFRPAGAPNITADLPNPTKPVHFPQNLPTMGGVVIDDQGLNIPVPRDARLRFSIVIPDYDSTATPISDQASGWGAVDVENPNNRPWESQIISWTLTILEGAEE